MTTPVTASTRAFGQTWKEAAIGAVELVVVAVTLWPLLRRFDVPRAAAAMLLGATCGMAFALVLAEAGAGVAGVGP